MKKVLLFSVFASDSGNLTGCGQEQAPADKGLRRALSYHLYRWAAR